MPSSRKFVDPCETPSKTLLHAQGSTGRLITGRALLGGVLGAGVGMLTSKDKGRGAITGAIAGAGLGAASGYLEAKRRAFNDRNALAGSVYQDIANSNAEAARALRAFTEVRTCRVAAAAAIKVSLEHGQIDRDTATAQLAEHRKRFEREIAAAEKFAKGYDDDLGHFREAAGFLAEGRIEDQAYLAQLAPGPAPPPPADLVSARVALTVRESASFKSAAVGKLARGESAEVIDASDPQWRQLRLSNGTKGFVQTRSVIAKTHPAPPRIDMAKVSPEVRSVSQPLFEGVEKRDALDSQIKLAHADTANATFTL